MLSKVFGTERPLFLCRHEEHHDRTTGRRRERSIRARDREHLRHARRIVHRAVIDLVTFVVGRADAEVIVMRRIDDQLLA